MNIILFAYSRAVRNLCFVAVDQGYVIVYVTVEDHFFILPLNAVKQDEYSKKLIHSSVHGEHSGENCSYLFISYNCFCTN